MTEAVSSPNGAPLVGPRSRRRMVLWISLAVAVVLAVLIAVLATSGKEGQLSGQSPLLGRMAPQVSGPNLLASPSVPGQPATAGLTGGAPGHWVLINFAASWCVPCQQEMPQLLTFASDHLKGDAQIITVAYQEGDESALTAYFRSRKVTWPLIDDNSAKVAYGVTGIPESYLVDPEGRVVLKVISGVNADAINNFIAQYSAPGQA